MPNSTRTTILLLGSDHRSGTAQAINTDTMLVLSVDAAQQTALMLSLPRDIYTKIPETFQQGRISTAYAIGQESGTAGDGGILAIKTVEELLGIPIDHYMLVDFAVFYAVIDAIGPITVCPKQPIYDDHFPGLGYNYTTVSFPAGCQDLDSVRLMQYARVRHNAGYDFGRAQRQQEIIRGIRSRVLSLYGALRLFRHFRALWNTLRDNIETNLSFDEMLRLARIALQIPRQNIYSGVPTVQNGQLRNGTTLANEQVLIPVADALAEYVQFLFSANPSNAEIKPTDQPKSLAAWNSWFAAQMIRAVISAVRGITAISRWPTFRRLTRQPKPAVLPNDFSLAHEEIGVKLFQHSNGGSLIVIANLQQGALIDLLYGDIIDPGIGRGDYGGSSPTFLLQTAEERWGHPAHTGLNLFCITNGQFFSTDEFPATPLAFPLKVNGAVISTGYGKHEYPNQKLMLEIWPHKAAISPFSSQRFAASSAPSIIVGLTGRADKMRDDLVPRTFVGTADFNRDGSCESLLILTASACTQKTAAKLLRAFGAKHVMMLDGGSSTQLVHAGQSKIAGFRTVPQMIAISAGQRISAPSEDGTGDSKSVLPAHG